MLDKPEEPEDGAVEVGVEGAVVDIDEEGVGGKQGDKDEDPPA